MYVSGATEPRHRMSSGSRLLEGTLAAAFFAVLAIALMYPVLPAPGSRVYGLPSDPLGEVWRLAQFERHEISLVGDGLSRQANAPSGVELRRPADVSQILYDVPASFLARALGAVPAYSLLVFLGFWTAGLATYASLRSLDVSWAGGAVGGTLFTVAPAHLVEAQLHVALALVFMLPVLLALGIRAVEQPSWRLGALFGATVALCGYVTGYLFLEAAALAVGVAGAACVRAFLDNGSRGPLGRAAASAVLSGLAVGAPLLIVFGAYSGDQLASQLDRPLVDVASFSLRARDYFDPSSSTYIGLIGFTLAAASLFGPTGSMRRWVLALVGVSGFLVSLGPELSVLGLDIPMPSEIIHSLVPYWRVFGRTAIVVSLAGACLAAILVDRLASSRRMSLRLSALAVSLLAVADVIQRPPPPAADLGRVDPLAEALRDGDGAVAEYPLFGFDNYELGPYLFRQLRHGRPLLNGSVQSSTSADLAAAAAIPTYREAREALSLAGVRSVVIHPEATRPTDPAFRVTARFSDGTAIYSVSPARDPVIASVRHTYDAEAGPDGTPFSWLRQAARLRVIAAKAGRVSVHFDAVSPEVARTVRFGSAVRRVLPTPTPIRLCVRTDPDGTATLQVSMTPLPRRLPGGDIRVTGIGLFHLQAERGCTDRALESPPQDPRDA